MSGGLIINSPLRHLGVREHGDDEKQEKCGHSPPKRRNDTEDQKPDSATRKMVRKDRKICRGRFFIRRKNSRSENASRESREKKGRVPKRSADRAKGGLHRKKWHNGTHFRETPQSPVLRRGVPYHLRKTHQEEERVPEEVQTVS